MQGWFFIDGLVEEQAPLLSMIAKKPKQKGQPRIFVSSYG